MAAQTTTAASPRRSDASTRRARRGPQADLGVRGGQPPVQRGSSAVPDDHRPQIRAAVWHSIIAGARWVIYFQHSFGIGQPCYGDHHTLRSDCHGNRQAVKSVNAQVKGVAPVLNAPFVTSGHSATGDVKHMVKFFGGKFYVIAGAHNGGGQATFSIPCVGDATAVVAGENRSVPVNDGQFTDSFTDRNSVHIYRLDGGSSCGL